MGAPNVLEVLDPAVEVGVLLEVGADGNSGTVGELGPGVAHGAGEQEISPGGSELESSYFRWNAWHWVGRLIKGRTIKISFSCGF